MKVLKMEVGMLGTNCYIAVNEATGHGVVCLLYTSPSPRDTR